MAEQGYSGAMGEKLLHIASCIFGWFSVMIRASLKSNIKLMKLKAPTMRVGLLRSRIKTIVASPHPLVKQERV